MRITSEKDCSNSLSKASVLIIITSIRLVTNLSDCMTQERAIPYRISLNYFLAQFRIRTHAKKEIVHPMVNGKIKSHGITEEH